METHDYRLEKKPFTIGSYIDMLTSERPVRRVVILKRWWRE